MNKTYAPIIVFVYNRPVHTKKMFESLAKNKQAKNSDIFIYSDSPKNEQAKENVTKVREYINDLPQKNLFKSVTIVNAKQNKGLANSVIDGVSNIINKYGKVIVLEDDLILSKHFIQYMNDALNFYQNNKKIWSISGYNLPIDIPKEYKKEIYLGYRGCSWGWATWKDRWDKVDWSVSDYKKIKNSFFKRKKFNRGGNDMALMLDAQMQGRCNSWAIRWCYQQHKENMYTIYPVNSLIKNIGLDGTGTHSKISTNFNINIDTNNDSVKFTNELILNKKILKKFKQMFNGGIKQMIAETLSILGLYELIYKMRHKK